MFGSNKETGTALLELAIITPALLLFSLIAFDAGQVVRNHFVLAQTVRESVRQASSLANLEPGQNELASSDPTTWLCNKGGSCPSRSAQLLNLTRKILEIQSQSLDIDIGKTTITSVQDPGTKTVAIRIQTTYRGLFLPFAGMTISCSSTGPYI